ncbi:MAG TPA: hypothetical protein VFZ53_03855 [Polyangiaceae bacterium]
MRRLRGDEGPLPKLTIELLDAGYRAIDPELKVRYIVTEAPADMPVTAGAQVRHSTQPPPANERTASAIPPAVKAPAASVALPATPSVAPAAPVVSARSVAPSGQPSEAPAGLLAAQVIRQRDEQPTAESPILYRELALAVRPGAAKDAVEALMRARLEQARTSLNAGEAQQYVQIAVFDHMFVKKPVRPPVATLAWKNWRGDPVLAFPGYTLKPESVLPAGASTRPPSWTEGASEPPKAPSLAPAPVVAVGSASVPPAPLPAVVVAASAPVPRPVGAAPAAAPAVAPERARTSVIPAPVVAVGVRSPSQAPPAPAAPAPEAEIVVPLVAKRGEPPPLEELDIPVELPPPSSSPLHETEVAPASGPLIEIEVASVPASELPLSAAPPGPSEPPPNDLAGARGRAASVPPAAPATKGSVPPPASSGPAPSSRMSPVPPSGTPRRRAPGEDLIGDLFERMHELAFMADMVSGAEFVLQVLRELIPCEGIVVHVFDLGKREFVVVRAYGPNVRDALLHRTPGDEPLVRSIMARHNATILDGAPANVPPASSSLAKLGIAPASVLCGAARLGGRYIGLIELANPSGGTPFHAGEANALDYVCEQFAEFVASRPIVLDADVVMGS